MKLFLVHCGFYDQSINDGLFESHANFFVAAPSFDEARLRAKQIPDFINKKMHIDGLQEIQAVDGKRVFLQDDITLTNQNIIINYKHRDLATKQPSSTTSSSTEKTT